MAVSIAEAEAVKSRWVDLMLGKLLIKPVIHLPHKPTFKEKIMKGMGLHRGDCGKPFLTGKMDSPSTEPHKKENTHEATDVRSFGVPIPSDVQSRARKLGAIDSQEVRRSNWKPQS